MNDAFAALQRLRSGKTAAVAGVLVPAAAALVQQGALSSSVQTQARRIRALPEWNYEELMRQTQPGGPLDYTERLRVPGGTMVLKPIQNLALHWVEQKKGLVGPLAVGSGKTIISLLASVILKAQRPVLFVPPTLQIPLRREIEKLSKHFRLPTNLYIIPYSQLSVASSTALLEQIKPDLIICDECFPYETKVVTDVGDIPIGDIVEKGRGSKVLSYDTEARRFVWKDIARRLRKSLSMSMVQVEHENGIFTCTENHKIWTTNRGYVKAGELEGSDYLLSLRQGEGGLPEGAGGSANDLCLQLQASGSREVCRLRGAYEPLPLPCDSNLREAGVPPSARGSEDDGFEAPDENEGVQGVPCVQQDVLAFGLWGDREEAGHLLLDLYGGAGVSKGGGGKQAEEGVPSETCSSDVRGVRQPFQHAYSGRLDGEVLLPFLLLEGGQPKPEHDGVAQREGDSSAGEEAEASGGAGLLYLWEPVSLPSGNSSGQGVFSSLREKGGGGQAPGEGQGEEPCLCGAYAEEQPIFSARGEGEDVCLHEGAHVLGPRGEWEADRAAGEAVAGVEQRPDGVLHKNGGGNGALPLSPPLLQGGHRAAGGHVGDRGGRKEPQHPQVEVPRPPEGGGALLSRVVRVAVLEQRGGHGFTGGSGEDRGHVYDLEVADTHSYIADGVVVSNCHMIKSASSARTKRVLRYFRQYPTTRFIALSGTLTSKGLRDYAHLCELALREGSPLPTEEADLIAWANCIDSGSQPQERDWSAFAAFSDLRHIPDTNRRQDEARAVFQRRFTRTPGVVATTEASVQCSLNLYEREVETPPEVEDALAALRRSWSRPDGEVMESALDMWRLGMQLSQGFWLRWVWPNGVVDHEWLNARAEWHRQVRYVVERSITGLDSPFLVWQAVSRGLLTQPDIIRAWAAWDAVRHRPTPPTETVWISDFLIRDALRWLREHPKGLIWHNDRATEAALRAAGVPTYGRKEVPPLDGSRKGMALSVRVHGTGLNLQYAHSENLILSFPSSGKTMEQLLGRTHRQGQEADEVTLHYYQHTGAAREAVITARADARYNEDTQGSPMKLCYGTWV